MSDTGDPSGSVPQWTRSAPVFMRQNSSGEYEFSSEPFEDEFQPGPVEGLCQKCCRIPWEQVINGEEDDGMRPPPTVFKFTGEYADASFGEGRIPSFEKIVKTQEFCSFCRLWLHARVAMFPDREIGYSFASSDTETHAAP
jgi:hypothetical protein